MGLSAMCQNQSKGDSDQVRSSLTRHKTECLRANCTQTPGTSNEYRNSFSQGTSISTSRPFSAQNQKMKSDQKIVPQFDGPPSCRPPYIPIQQPACHPIIQRSAATKTAIHDLLPFCTTEAPLTQEQVIGLSDLAGNLKEIMVLALWAKTNKMHAADRLRVVAGPRAISGIMDFFSDEFEM